MKLIKRSVTVKLISVKLISVTDTDISYRTGVKKKRKYKLLKFRYNSMNFRVIAETHATTRVATPKLS